MIAAELAADVADGSPAAAVDAAAFLGCALPRPRPLPFPTGSVAGSVGSGLMGLSVSRSATGSLIPQT